MYKIYSKSEILDKISDKVKSVEDLSKLSRGEFDRECCDYWYDEYLNDSEYRNRGYITNSTDIEFFISAFYLMECRKECKYLVLVEVEDSLYFIFDPRGLTHLQELLEQRREELLRKVSGLTTLLPQFDDDNVFEEGYDHFLMDDKS